MQCKYLSVLPVAVAVGFLSVLDVPELLGAGFLAAGLGGGTGGV